MEAARGAAFFAGGAARGGRAITLTLGEAPRSVKRAAPSRMGACSVPGARPVQTRGARFPLSQPPVATAPFPIGSVQGVASRAWELCLRRDPLGLVVVPFIIFFPVYVFLSLLTEVLRDIDRLADEGPLLGAILGVMPLVVFARVLGEAWIQVRTDSEAHGHVPGWGESFSRALARSWYLVIVMLVVYALVQVGIFLFVIPGLILYVLCSFANQAAVLGPGRLVASLRVSRDLVEHHAPAWFGMVAYWVIVFLGLGILIGILRQSIAPHLSGGDAGFMANLVLGLPLQVCLLVFTCCWTLFYRELEARRALHLAAHPPPAPRASTSDPPAAPAGSGHE